VLDLGIDPMARQMPARCPQRDARHARAVLYAGRSSAQLPSLLPPAAASRR
jgi:hypothetical protein